MNPDPLQILETLLALSPLLKAAWKILKKLLKP